MSRSSLMIKLNRSLPKWMNLSLGSLPFFGTAFWFYFGPKYHNIGIGLLGCAFILVLLAIWYYVSQPENRYLLNNKDTDDAIV